MLEKILSNPIFIKEKWEHDRYCEDGFFVVVNKFTGRVTYERCLYCKRIDDFKEQKKLEKMGNINGQDKAASSE